MLCSHIQPGEIRDFALDVDDDAVDANLDQTTMAIEFQNLGLSSFHYLKIEPFLCFKSHPETTMNKDSKVKAGWCQSSEMKAIDG